MLVDEPPQVAGSLEMVAAREAGVVEPLVGHEAQLVEAHGRAHRPRLLAELGQCLAAPQAERFGDGPDAGAGVAGGSGGAGGQQRLEAAGVDVVPFHVEAYPAPSASGPTPAGSARRNRER